MKHLGGDRHGAVCAWHKSEFGLEQEGSVYGEGKVLLL